MKTLKEALEEALNETARRKTIFELQKIEPIDLGFIEITKSYTETKRISDEIHLVWH